MKLNQDFHIHTHCSCDSANASIAHIVEAAQKSGIKHFGISDHIHTQFNMPDLEIARREFLEYGHVEGFHFGVEISCATAWECEKIAKRDFASCFSCEVNGRNFQTMTPIDGIMYGGPAGGPLQLDITDGDIKRLGLEYLIGGVHKPNYTDQNPKDMIDDFFNQSCFLIKHEFIDILAHPWLGLAFWSGWAVVTKDPADVRQDAFTMIPQDYWDEMAKLLVENNTLAEVNLSFLMPENIFHLYMKQLAGWREKGVKFTYGSDLHKAPYNVEKLQKTEKFLTEYGFTENDFSLPCFR
jgi:histidinol phosphatase-like PHP family hydrolase